VGYEALPAYNMQVTLDGEALTADEIRQLLDASDGLVLVRGRWVEVNRERLSQTIDRFREIERAAAEHGLPFGEAMRLLTRADAADAEDAPGIDWWQVVAGPWLSQVLQGLRSPEGLAQADPGASLHALLRPYQQVGVRWLYFLAKLGLGGCLADDMGLGKTIQVLSLLLVLKAQQQNP